MKITDGSGQQWVSGPELVYHHFVTAMNDAPFQHRQKDVDEQPRNLIAVLGAALYASAHVIRTLATAAGVEPEKIGEMAMEYIRSETALAVLDHQVETGEVISDATTLPSDIANQRLLAWKAHEKAGLEKPDFPEPVKVKGVWHVGPRWACACGKDHTAR